MEGLSAICAGLVAIEDDDLGNPIGYSKHDYCLDNLKDLLRFLRRDDPEKREVFKQVCKWNIVGKDLIPIIEQFQDDRNLVLNAVKVLVFLTMPVEPTSHDIPQQLDYLWGLKASITSSDIVPVIVSLLETPLENLESEEFTEEDWKLVQLVFTLFRNVLAILDIPPQQKAGGSATQFVYLRDKLLELLFHENVMDLILVLTHHVGGSCKYLRNDNLLLLEILHYIFTGQDPELIAKAYMDCKIDGDSKTTNSLKSMMEEDKRKLAKLRTMSCYAQLSGIFTRPTMNGSKTLLKGNPCTSYTEALLKSHKVHRGPQKKVARDHGSLPSIDDKILELLHDFVNQLLSGGYNVLMQSIRLDIEKEHHTIQNNDVVVFFQVAQFVTSFQHHKLLSKKVETDFSEASKNNRTDSTLFRGNVCGPIAATMNESMFQLVVSKWRYAYDGLKETNDYNYVSAAGSIMKTMIRMFDSVLKVSPEDSKEPQTARVLLYKLLYDQTDEGMTRFLLNQIKAFDNHKQPKSDLVDLVETIYVVIRLMENLQARGTLRVSRKSWKKRTKRKSNDKNDKPEKPVEDVPVENVVSSCEPPSDSAVFSEKLNDTISDEKDEDMETTKKMSEENNDDMYDENDDSSHDEQITATKEVDFNVSSLVSALASNTIIKNLCWLLKFYKGNSLRTNHYVICLLKKICDDLELSPMLYQLSYLTTFYMIIEEQKNSPSREYENINEFLTTLVRRMIRKMKSQPLLFIEVLFLKTRNECHYINCESLEKEVGKLKIEGEKFGSFSHYGEIGSTQEKGWAHGCLADALGDDEADFVEEHPYSVEINNECFEVEREDAPFVANDGSRNQKNYGSDRNLEPGLEKLCKRRKRLVLDEEVESKIKDLYEIHKNDRHCSRLISEALDLDGNISPAQISNKLRQLGLKIQPKKRMLQSEAPDNRTEEEGRSSLSPNHDLNENSALKPLHTRKRVRAFSEAQEMAIRNLFERFKGEKKCNHMIAIALDNDGKYKAAQISRKLKQLGLQIPKQKKSGVNTQLVDEGEHSDNETLLILKKRSKKMKTQRDIHEVAAKNIDGKSSEGDSDDERLLSAIVKARGQSNSGCEQGDTPNVPDRDSDRSSEIGANNPEDFTVNETSYISSEKEVEVMIADDEKEVTRQHLENYLEDQFSDSGDEANPVTLPKDAVLRRKAKLVIDFDNDDD